MLRKLAMFTLCLVLFSLTVIAISERSAKASSWDFHWTIDPNYTNQTAQLGYNDAPAIYYWDNVTGKYWHIDNKSNNRVIRSGTTYASMADTGYSASISGVTGSGAQAWPYHIFRSESDGVFYMIVHVEYDYGVHPGHHHLFKVGLASTTDPNLASWTYEGDLVTVDSGLSSDGAGDPGFFQYGDKYYLFYAQKYNGLSGLFVARASTSDFGPGDWTKWYDGSYSQPGIGGLQSPVIGNNSTSAYAQPTVSWNSYLNRFVIVFNDASTWVGTGDLTNVGWAISYSTDTTNLASWETPRMFYQFGSEGWSSYKELYGVGSSGGKDSDWVTGQDNFLYFSAIPGYVTQKRNVAFHLGPAPKTHAGFDTPSANTETVAANHFVASKTTPTQDIAATTLNLYVASGATGNARMGIYADNAGSPGAKLAETPAVALSNGWNTGTIPATNLTAGTPYWLVFDLSNTGSVLTYKPLAGAGKFAFYSYPSSSLPATAPSGLSAGGGVYSIFASGTAMGLETPAGYTETMPAKYFVAVKATPGQNMTANSLNLYVASGAKGNARLGIYSDQAGKPGTKLAETLSLELDNGWNKGSIPATGLTAGTTYWLVFNLSSPGNVLTYNPVAGGNKYASSPYVPTLPATAPSLTTGGGTYAIYASSN